MNASKTLAIAAFAAVVSVGAHAGTSGELGDAPVSYATAPVVSGADRAAVAATARDGNAIVGDREEGVAAAAPGPVLSRDQVHALAVRAEHAGEVPRGEG